MPNVFVISGPNGAGKSTAAPLLIGQRLGIAEFVNADVIAAGISAFSPESAAIEAGRIMLRRLRQVADDGKDFAFETTLASRSFAPWIASLRRERNYRFHLAYLWLTSPELAVTRVGERIRTGGHAVPPDDIRRRYRRGLSNFFSLYMPIADSWAMYDNSLPPARLIASKDGGRPVRIDDSALWQTIQDTMRFMEKEGEYAVGAEPRLMGVPVSEITEILTRAGRDALARHKALGQSVAVWRDGRVVVIPPEEIDI